MTSPADRGAGDRRCFLALLPNAASLDALGQCREILERAHAGAARRVRWIDAGSLHLTLRFLGDTTVGQADYFAHMLPTLARELPATAARRCAIWPNRAQPRLLVLELQAPDALLALARACELLARKAGFEPDTRAFRAHLTLARLRPGCSPQSTEAPVAPLTFGSLALMASELLPSGARYRALASMPLAARRES